MPTIIVEDGSIVANANSYVAVADLATFAANRGITINASDTTILLIKAMDYIESLRFVGRKYTQDQLLQWPRARVYIDGFPLLVTSIPNELKEAEMQCALAIDEMNDPLQDLPVALRSERVDSIDVNYRTGTSMLVINRRIRATLWKLLIGGGYGYNTTVVSRG